MLKIKRLFKKKKDKNKDKELASLCVLFGVPKKILLKEYKIR